MRFAIPYAVSALVAFAMPCAAASPTEQTIVFMRHAEKPRDGLGQLTCQGLNRAMVLPHRLALYGKAIAVFAPNPSDKKKDSGVSYDYVRPLATIEPTAVDQGLPVDTDIGFEDADGLRRALEAPKLRSGLTFVAWEHHLIVDVVRKMMADNGGDPASVPDWGESDFDGLYVLHIMRNADKPSVVFSRDFEGLDDMPKECR